MHVPLREHGRGVEEAGEADAVEEGLKLVAEALADKDVEERPVLVQAGARGAPVARLRLLLGGLQRQRLLGLPRLQVAIVLLLIFLTSAIAGVAGTATACR